VAWVEGSEGHEGLAVWHDPQVWLRLTPGYWYFDNDILPAEGRRCGSRSWRRVPSAVITARAWPQPAMMSRSLRAEPMAKPFAERAKVESALGDLHLKNVQVTDDSKRVGQVDVVLFAVKLWDTESAGEQTRPLVGRDTRVITLQNGVDSVERLAPILGDDVTIGGATYVAANIARPGLIRQTGTAAKIHCGRVDGRRDALLAGYVQQMKSAGIDITLTDHMLFEIWKKFVVLSGTSAITASTRQPLGAVRDDTDMRALFFRLMHETMSVGHAAGVRFPPEFPAELERLVASFPPTMKASMANDLEAGNRLELDWLAGKVVALGRKHGVPTPAQEAVYAILKPYRMGRMPGTC